MSSESTSTLGALSPDDKKKLDETIRAGLKILQEKADISDGLKDLVKNVAGELGIEAKALNVAITTAFRSTLAKKREEMDTVEDILAVTGYA